MQVALKCPVFAFLPHDNMIYVFFRDDRLKSTSVQFLQKDGYRDSTILDCTGTLYTVQSAYKVKYRGLWGFNPLLKGRQIVVEFEFSPDVRTILVEEFKEDVIKRINKTREIWESAWDIDELVEEVKRSRSFEEIAELLK